METTKDKIIKQKRQLYPSGRAFYMKRDGYMYTLHNALAVSEAQAYEDSISILSSLLPDNDAFTPDDATDWERRLGMVTNLAIPFADRKDAIRRKMAAPGIQPARGHYLYLERQLQAAGFNVWVHENLFPTYPTGFVSVDPATLYGTTNFVSSTYGYSRYGQKKYGSNWNNKIANSLSQEADNAFDLGGTFASTFFIGGQTIGTYANVLATRAVEFRQLILQLKQLQSIGFDFTNKI